jgi:hypothetical protein
VHLHSARCVHSPLSWLHLPPALLFSLLKPQRRNLSDPDNYALAATGRLQLSSSTSLKLTAQVDSLAHLQPLMPQGGRIWQQQQQQQQRGWAKMGQNSSLSMQLKQQLEGLDLTADLAVNEPSVEGVRRYATTPLRLAVDLGPSSSSKHGSSSSSKLKGLLFRVGLHGVVAPVEGSSASDSQPQRQQQQHALSVHCQGAVALSGSKTVWEAAQKPWQSAAAAAKEQRAKRQKQRQKQLEAAQQAIQEQDQQQQKQQAELQVQPLQVGSSSSSSSSSGGNAGHSTAGSPSTAAAAAAGDMVTAAHEPASAEQHHTSSKHHHHHHHHKGSSSSSSRHAAAKSGSTTTTTATSTTRNSSSSSTGRKRHLTLQGQEIPLPLCSPAAVQDSIQDNSSRLERLRSELRQLRGRVEAGDLQHLGEGKKSAAGGGLGGLVGRDAGSCWSSFLAGPHLKVGQEAVD